MKKKKKFNVLKASGEVAPFDAGKLRFSLHKAGADDVSATEIINKITAGLYEGISTYEIYRRAFDMLRARSRSVAAKYKLKNAIMELGPSGFPFESYFCELLKHQGFNASINQFIQGKCVMHEVDVLAVYDGVINYVECKYHNDRGHVTDVKIPLYVQSRFTDLRDFQTQQKENRNLKFKGWLVTNTKFSVDAIKYGLCAGLELVGWDFPLGRSLREMIDISGLHPITCLTTLTAREKQALLDKKIVLVRDLQHHKNTLQAIGIKQNRLNTVLSEAAQLCL